MRLKPSSYLILGMLRSGVDTGYAIKRAVDQSTRFFWAASFAQVYPELSNLQRHGYIVGQQQPRGDRPRTIYRLTRKGAKALKDWLSSERAPSFEFRDEGLLRLFFADGLTEREAAELASRLRRHAEELNSRFREEILPIAESSSQEEGLRFPFVAARLGADYYQWRMRWLARLEAELAERTGRPRES